MIPESAFWNYSLRLYARPGVAEACLSLQARRGIDVNLLFCCLWLGISGKRLGKRDVSRMMARVRALHEGVVKPLREARTVLKGLLPNEDETLRPAVGALRAAVKKSELDAEHIEQAMLDRLWPQPEAADRGSPDLARANALAYLTVAGGRLGGRDSADLERIVESLPSAGSAKLNDAKPPGPARKRPLARQGQGRTI
jgi:uncharacterized protein (TIGR02444 family)